jgi:hypothetical protein
MLTPQEFDQLRALADRLYAERVQGASALRRSIEASTRWHLVDRTMVLGERAPPLRKVVLVWVSGGSRPYCGYVGEEEWRGPRFTAYYGDVEVSLPIVAWCDCIPPDPLQAANISEKRKRRARATGTMSPDEAELLRILSDRFEDEGEPTCQLLRRFIEASTTWHSVSLPISRDERIPAERKVVLVRLFGRKLPYCGYVRYVDGYRERPQFVVYHRDFEIVSHVVAWCDCLPHAGPTLPPGYNEPLSPPGSTDYWPPDHIDF